MSTCAPKSVRQSARFRTSKCPAPYVKVPGLLIGTGGAVAPLGSYHLADVVAPASESTTEPGGRMPPGPGPVRWIRTVTPGRPGRRVRPAASARRIGAGVCAEPAWNLQRR